MPWPKILSAYWLWGVFLVCSEAGGGGTGGGEGKALNQAFFRVFTANRKKNKYSKYTFGKSKNSNGDPVKLGASLVNAPLFIFSTSMSYRTIDVFLPSAAST